VFPVNTTKNKKNLALQKKKLSLSMNYMLKCRVKAYAFEEGCTLAGAEFPPIEGEKKWKQ